jgi:CheY-like chemotaxis protein
MAGESILVVEDNDKNLKLVRDLLQLRVTRSSKDVRRNRVCAWQPNARPAWS